MISHWLKRRVRVRPMTESEEEEVATKIQAGYRGLVTREEMRAQVIRVPDASQVHEEGDTSVTAGYPILVEGLKSFIYWYIL